MAAWALTWLAQNLHLFLIRRISVTGEEDRFMRNLLLLVALLGLLAA